MKKTVVYTHVPGKEKQVDIINIKGIEDIGYVQQEPIVSGPRGAHGGKVVAWCLEWQSISTLGMEFLEWVRYSGTAVDSRKFLLIPQNSHWVPTSKIPVMLELYLWLCVRWQVKSSEGIIIVSFSDWQPLFLGPINKTMDALY